MVERNLTTPSTKKVSLRSEGNVSFVLLCGFFSDRKKEKGGTIWKQWDIFFLLLVIMPAVGAG